jgi:hypothetical protein
VPTPTPPDPHAAYAARLADRRAAVAAFDARLDRLGRARLGVVLAGVAAGLVGWATGTFPGWAGLLAAVPLFALFLLGKALAVRRAAADRAVRYYRDGLDRLAGTWAGRGPTGDRFAEPAHLYAADLDLFGDGSLFQRLCAARTAGGQRLLADWLLGPADTDEVRSRQEAVADLRDRLDLREYLAALGAAPSDSADVTPLAAWGTEPPRPVERWRRVAVLALGWFNLLAVLGWLAAGTTALPLLLGLVASAAVAWPLVGWARAVARPVEEAANDLLLLQAVLARLEREPFAAPRLTALRASLASGGASAAARVWQLRTIAEWSAARRNPFFLPVTVLMLWDVRTAFRLDEWRARSGPLVGRWLAAVAELEALGSLAGYAFENPQDPFPEVSTAPRGSRPTGWPTRCCRPAGRAERRPARRRRANC